MLSVRGASVAYACLQHPIRIFRHEGKASLPIESRIRRSLEIGRRGQTGLPIRCRPAAIGEERRAKRIVRARRIRKVGIEIAAHLNPKLRPLVEIEEAETIRRQAVAVEMLGHAYTEQ